MTLQFTELECNTKKHKELKDHSTKRQYSSRDLHIEAAFSLCSAVPRTLNSWRGLKTTKVHLVYLGL